MPRQDRPVIKDGRLVVPKKKRTDRSYLQPSAPSTLDEPEPLTDIAVAPDETAPEAAADPTATAAFAAPPVPTPAPARRPAAPAAAPAPAAYTPAPRSSTARALQQQGVRKRRDVDLGAVARRDSAYALHELRRIAILAVIVVLVLVVLTFTLR